MIKDQMNKLSSEAAKRIHHGALIGAYVCLSLVLVAYIFVGINFCYALATDHDSRGILSLVLIGTSSVFGYGISSICSVVAIFVRYYRKQDFPDEKAYWHLLRWLPIGLLLITFAISVVSTLLISQVMKEIEAMPIY